MDKIKIYCVNL